MCGIIGYIGNKEAVEVLVDGLKKLEYRGYDSAGIAIIGKGGLVLNRCEGKISNLEERLRKRIPQGKVGVGHTRWATHGRPSEENAHPHTDCKGRLVVVHNGIIENYLPLKKKLKSEGHRFKSETDTEVIAHLIEKHFRKDGQLLAAVQKALKEVQGSYALAVISADEGGSIIAARRESPLIIGRGKGENLIASDVPAILGRTREVIYLDDGEVARIKKDGVEVYNKDGEKVAKKISTISWDPVMAEKGGFKHFMLKEIFEQPRAIQDSFRGRLAPDKGEVYLDEINLKSEEIKGIERIFFVACGTAYHAGLIGKFLLEDLTKVPCEVDIGSEFRYRNPLLSDKDLVVAISQSGETADTLAGLREAKMKGAKTIAICNVLGSTATREADGIIYTHAGPEIGVASTKAFTAQLVALYILAIYLGRAKGTMKKELAKDLMINLLRIPRQVKEILDNQSKISSCARKYFKKENYLYLGRNINYPIALEGALKLKEISYIHAEGYPAGEMKHGPIALIDEGMPVLVIATKGRVYEKILTNIQEVKARYGILIALATRGDKVIKKMANDIFYLPDTLEVLSPLLSVIPLQLLAYYTALFRGCDIDQPRNLAKSVTVE